MVIGKMFRPRLMKIARQFIGGLEKIQIILSPEGTIDNILKIIMLLSFSYVHSGH